MELDLAVTVEPGAEPVEITVDFDRFGPEETLRAIELCGPEPFAALTVGKWNEQAGAAQHGGLGTSLLIKAEQIAKDAGYSKLVVIAAVGTRLYYEKRGFIRTGLYMTKEVV